MALRSRLSSRISSAMVGAAAIMAANYILAVMIIRQWKQRRAGSADIHLRVGPPTFWRGFGGSLAEARRPSGTLRGHIAAADAARSCGGRRADRVLLAHAHGYPASRAADWEDPRHSA